MLISCGLGMHFNHGEMRARAQVELSVKRSPPRAQRRFTDPTAGALRRFNSRSVRLYCCPSHPLEGAGVCFRVLHDGKRSPCGVYWTINNCNCKNKDNICMLSTVTCQ